MEKESYGKDFIFYSRISGCGYGEGLSLGSPVGNVFGYITYSGGDGETSGFEGGWCENMYMADALFWTERIEGVWVDECLLY